MCLLGIVGRPGVSWGVLWCLGVSWGNKTDRFFTIEIPYSKLLWDRTFLIVDQFSKFLQHILGQTKRQILQRK